MSWFVGIGMYVVLWWIAIFAVLPWGVKPSPEGDPGHAAVRLLANLVQREALVLTYNDLLMLIGGLFVCALMLMPLVRHQRSLVAR